MKENSDSPPNEKFEKNNDHFLEKKPEYDQNEDKFLNLIAEIIVNIIMEDE